MIYAHWSQYVIFPWLIDLAYVTIFQDTLQEEKVIMLTYGWREVRNAAHAHSPGHRAGSETNKIFTDVIST